MVIGGHFGGGDHFDGGDHFGGGTRATLVLKKKYFAHGGMVKENIVTLKDQFVGRDEPKNGCEGGYMSTRPYVCLIQGHNSGLRTWPKKWRIPWGLWDCKSREMTVQIVFHFEFLNLNHKGIVWKEGN